MATQIQNQATLSYYSGDDSLTSISNIATATLQGLLDVTKYALENEYQVGESITYSLFITNSTEGNLSGLSVIDNLGTFLLDGVDEVTPLTFVGPAKLFINNIYSADITGTLSTEGDSVTFAIGTLNAGATALLEYKTIVNEYAETTIDESVITNTAYVTADTFAAAMESSVTIPIASYAQVTIEKEMAPDPLVDNGPILYTFTLRNFGTIDATNVTLRDEFTTIPDIETVLIDHVETSEHSFTSGVFLFPSTSSTYEFTVPKATFTRDPVTDIVSITPGVRTIVVSGTI